MRRPNVNGSTVALALAAIALFVSLGGPALAAKKVSSLVGNKQLKNNAVTSKKIAKGAVKNSDLGKGSVSSSKLATGSVGNTKLANGAVTNGKLGAGSVTNGTLGAGSVTNGKLGAGSVTNGILGDGSVSNGKLGNGSVTNGKLGDGSVTNGKLGGNSVTSAKVQDGSLTAGDVAANTFLGATGTAVNANALGGFGAGSYATSDSGRASVLQNGAQATLMVVSTGTYRVSCPGPTPSKPTVTYDNASTAVDFAEQDFTSGGTFHFTTLNAINGGNSTSVASTNGNPFTATIQTGAKSDSRVTTAWVNGHTEGTTCIFTGQSISGK